MVVVMVVVVVVGWPVVMAIWVFMIMAVPVIGFFMVRGNFAHRRSSQVLDGFEPLTFDVGKNGN